MNCVIYARVSTEEQAELSIPAQVQAMRDFAMRRGWTVVEEYLEPGVSGRSVEQREALQTMLRRCKEDPRVGVVLVHKIDRLARNVLDHATIRFALQQRQIKLASVVENVDDSISGQLLENIMASIAQFYSGNLSEEVKKGMRMKVERGGWPHQPPRGYRILRDDSGSREFVIDNEDGRLIREAFERYATGRVALRDLRRQMTKDGFVQGSGKPVSLASVHRLLQNSFYAGRVRWHGAQYPGKHPALIPEPLFQKVQRVLRHRYRETGEKGTLHFLLRGVAKCGACGATMTAERHGRWQYYRCVKNTVDRVICSARFSNVQKSHKELVLLYGRLRLSDELRDRLAKAVDRVLSERSTNRQQRLKALNMKKSKLENREAKITEAYAAGDLSLNAYRSSLSSLSQQRSRVADGLARLDPDPIQVKQHVARVLKLASSLLDLHQTFDDRRQSHLLRIVFKRILIERSVIVGYELHSPFDRLLSDDDARSDGAHLEHSAVTSTIESILEFDVSSLSGVAS